MPHSACQCHVISTAKKNHAAAVSALCNQLHGGSLFHEACYTCTCPVEVALASSFHNICLCADSALMQQALH